MKKILIPIDFAESSVRAIQYAAEVFNEKQVEIHLIHVAPSTRKGRASHESLCSF